MAGYITSREKESSPNKSHVSPVVDYFSVAVPASRTVSRAFKVNFVLLLFLRFDGFAERKSESDHFSGSKARFKGLSAIENPKS